MPNTTRREVLAGAAAVVAASALPVPDIAPIVSAAPKPAWLLAAEATGTADYTCGPRMVDALIALPPSKREGIAVDPEKFDTDMQLELARALHAGYAELTPEGRLRMTPSGVRADEQEWACD